MVADEESPDGGDGGGLTSEHVRDLATIRDALMARFGRAGPGVGPGAPAGGTPPVASGARSRKAAEGGRALRRNLITVMATGAGATAGDKGGGDGGAGGEISVFDPSTASQHASPFAGSAFQVH
jgi:hypothetical protein